MKYLLTTLFVGVFLTAQAQLTFDMTWTGSAGSSATATMVIDETVCLQTGSCIGFLPLATAGVISLDLTITGGCAAGTYSQAAGDFGGIILAFPGPPDLNLDLVPQTSDINISSPNPNLNGIAPNVFGSCEIFTIVSMVPVGAVPTLGEWGIIIFTLLLLNLGIVMMLRRRRQMQMQLG